MINKTQLNEFTRIVILLSEKSEDNDKRLENIVEFINEINLFTKTLIGELAIQVCNKPILDLSEPKTDFVIEMLAKVVTISPNLNNNFEFAASFEKRFEDYIFKFGKYEAAITSKKATSTFIDEKIMKIGKKLDAFCEEIIIVDSTLEEHYSKFKELKNTYYTSNN